MSKTLLVLESRSRPGDTSVGSQMLRPKATAFLPVQLPPKAGNRAEELRWQSSFSCTDISDRPGSASRHLIAVTRESRDAFPARQRS